MKQTSNQICPYAKGGDGKWYPLLHCQADTVEEAEKLVEKEIRYQKDLAWVVDFKPFPYKYARRIVTREWI